jgi:plastocyanin
MRSARLAALVAVAALVLAACAGNTVPNWTYAPAPSTTPAASASGAAGSESPAASGSAAASGSPSASGSGGAGGASVEIIASGIQFTTNNVTAPAGQKLTLTFRNQDNGIPHDVDIKDPSGGDVFKTDITTGPTDKSYDFGPLQPGTYSFVCNVHPNMTGTLTVQ